MRQCLQRRTSVALRLGTPRVACSPQYLCLPPVASPVDFVAEEYVMVGFRSLLFGTAMLTLAAPLMAQRNTGTVTGRVIDRQTMRPVVGAQIRVSGTDRGASSDQTGA